MLFCSSTANTTAVHTGRRWESLELPKSKGGRRAVRCVYIARPPCWSGEPWHPSPIELPVADDPTEGRRAVLLASGGGGGSGSGLPGLAGRAGAGAAFEASQVGRRSLGLAGARLGLSLG